MMKINTKNYILLSVLDDKQIAVNVFLSKVSENDLLNLSRNLTYILADQMRTWIECNGVKAEDVPIMADRMLEGIGLFEMLKIATMLSLSLESVWKRIDKELNRMNSGKEE